MSHNGIPGLFQSAQNAPSNTQGYLTQQPTTQNPQVFSSNTQSHSPLPPQVAAQQQMATAAVQQNASLPGLEALQGISPDQLAAIVALLRSGQLPMTAPPANVPTTVDQPPAPIPQQNHNASAAGAAAAKVLEDAMDVDKEEGELSDTAKERDFIRPPPTGPRNQNETPRDRQGRASLRRESSFHNHRQSNASPRPNGTRRASDQRLQSDRRLSTNESNPPGKRGHSPSYMSDTPTNGKRRALEAPRMKFLQHRVSNSVAAKDFVLALHKTGIGYDSLVKEVRKPAQLGRVYKELRLPTLNKVNPDEQKSSGQVTDSAVLIPLQKTPVEASKTYSTEAAKPSIPKRPVPAKPGGGSTDRSEYLAKLQAAKNKKTEAASAANPQPKSSPTPKRPAEVEEVPTSVAPVSAPTSNRPDTTGKKPNVNELLRQRLEAARAQQAAKKNSSYASMPFGEMPSSSSSPAQPQSARPGVDPAKLRELDTAISAAVAMVKKQDAEKAAAAKAQATTLSTMMEPSPFACLGMSEQPQRLAFSPTAIPPMPNRSFSGLPGLFMAAGSPYQPTPPPQSQASSLPPPAQLHILEAQTDISFTQGKAAELATTPGEPDGDDDSMDDIFEVPSLSNVALSEAAPISGGNSSAPLNVLKKRPVAADFDMPQIRDSSAGTFKRPFGQAKQDSADESVIIQVSDNESDDEQDNVVEVAQPNGESTAKQKSIPDIGSLRDFPPKTDLQKPLASSAPGTPLVATPGVMRESEQLRKKEEELLKFKLQLAEMERKRAAKAKIKAVQAESATSSAGTPPVVASGAATPVIQPSPKVTNVLLSNPLAQPSEHLLKEAVRQPSATPISAQLASPKGSVSLGKRAAAEATREARRRALQEELERKQREIELLDQMHDNDMEQDDNDVAEVGPLLSRNPNQGGLDRDEAKESANAVTRTGPLSPKQPDTGPENAGSRADEGEISDAHAEEYVNHTDVSLSLSESGANEEEYVPDPPLSLPIDARKVGSQATTASASSAAVAAELQEPPTHANAAAEILESHPAQGVLAAGRPESDMDFNSSGEGSEEGEIEDDIHDAGGQNVNPRDQIDVGVAYVVTSSASSTDSDAHNLERMDPGPIEHAGHEGDDSESSEDGGSSTSPPAYSKEVYRPVTVRSDNVGAEADLAPELQPTNAEQPDTVPKPDTSTSNQTTFYTPYQSALTRFKAYRYHPDYLQTVPGGFKSMTYSHQVDPIKPLCPSESAGGVCNDPICPNQHFKSMELSDGDLLKLMGTSMPNIASDPAQTEKDVKRWNEGLKNIIIELRKHNKGKDAEAVAERIALYRREFVNDPTKVLNLQV